VTAGPKSTGTTPSTINDAVPEQSVWMYELSIPDEGSNAEVTISCIEERRTSNFASRTITTLLIAPEKFERGKYS
jgi:hypothetical protein